MKRLLAALVISTLLGAAGSCGSAGSGGEHTGTLGGGGYASHDAGAEPAQDAAPDVAEEAAPPDADVSDAAEAPDATGEADAAPPPEDAGPPPPEHLCPSPDPLDCSPGPGTGSGAECTDGPSCYLKNVQAAVNGFVNAHPEWFLPDPAHGDCPQIQPGGLDPFLDGVVDTLVADGLCAIRDPNAPGEEITVKHDNAFAESFDIVASWGCARSGAGIYTGYCAPAWW